MKTFYASLTGPLMGCYLKIEAETEYQVRVAMNQSKLKSLWCSVYEEPFEGGPRPPVVIPCRLAELPENWHDYNIALESDGEQPAW